jgi:hypothetical protein
MYAKMKNCISRPENALPAASHNDTLVIVPDDRKVIAASEIADIKKPSPKLFG